MKKLVISAHPDDETLGCGGTLLKDNEAGHELYWIVVTQAHEPRWSSDDIERKAAEVVEVAQAYGVKDCIRLGFPTIMLDTVPQDDIISKIRDSIEQVRPKQVYLVNGGDVHDDHQAVNSATMSVLKPFYMARLGVQRVLCYETLSSTEAAPPEPARAFVPNIFSDITGYLDRKIEMMDMYESEVHADPMPRGPSAIRALARYRGATIGVEHAEAFKLMRELV